MFSAISATLFAILEAMISYGEACCTAPFAEAPLAAFVAVDFELALGFLRDAGVLVLGRFTGAEATEAGMSAPVVYMFVLVVWD
jgi:hypothetical protein